MARVWYLFINKFQNFYVACQDVDECSEESSKCPNGQCINTVGGYKCQCESGTSLDPTGELVLKWSICISISQTHFKLSQLFLVLRQFKNNVDKQGGQKSEKLSQQSF